MEWIRKSPATPPIASPPSTGYDYNMSLHLNISSLTDSLFFGLPSKLLGRMRRIDDVLAQAQEQSQRQAASQMDQEQQAMIKLTNALASVAQKKGGVPTPWGFFTSGYMFGLLAMAILMHRLQNIVLPRTNRNSHRRTSEHLTNNPRQFIRNIYRTILPLNLSSTFTRFVLHLPTLYFLMRMLLLWSLVLLQTCSFLPSDSTATPTKLRSLVEWSSAIPMGSICIQTFLSICAAFCVETFIRSLDNAHGIGLDMDFAGTLLGAHVQGNTSPFNLVGYSFLLHVYSNPFTHVFVPEGLPSRPEKHVVITIMIPVIQLTLFHIMSIRKKWANHRLIPTALASFLSLLHFHGTLIAHSFRLEPITPPPNAPQAQATSRLYSAPPILAIPSYPLLNYIPNIFETLLLSSILLTVGLNGIAQLILNGNIDKPALGLGLGRTEDGTSVRIPWDEDFGVVLLRIGTASLEATGLRGWGNEVGEVVVPPALPSGSTVEMSRSGATVKHAYSSRRTPRKSKGLDNEIKSIQLLSSQSNTGFFSSLCRWALGSYWTKRWIRELWRFWRRGVWGVISGAFWRAWCLVTFRTPMRRERRVELKANVEKQGTEDDEIHSLETRRSADLYSRFARGETVSDDEDDPHLSDSSSSSVASSDAEGDDGGDHPEEMELELETARLLSDMNRLSPSPASSSQSHQLLAHLSNNGSPLTRRRYRALDRRTQDDGEDISPGSQPESISSVTKPRTSDVSGKGADDDDMSTMMRRNCVICVSEPREIICWPCRCLSMCDSCRESLASGISGGSSGGGKHRCPCCRGVVEGYSRVYVP